MYNVAGLSSLPGQTNDATNINAVMANGAGRYFLIPGQWNIGTTVSVAYDNVELVGAGWSTILRANNSLNADILTASTPSSTTPRYGFRIADLFIDGNQGGQTSGHGISLKGTYNARIDHVWCRYAHDIGLNIAQSSGGLFTAYTYMVNSLFTDGYGANAEGIRCGTGTEFTVAVSCNFDWHSGNQGKGIRIESGNNRFFACQADANAYNLFIGSNVYNHFQGCTFDRAFYREAWLTGGTLSNKFSDCVFGYFVASNTLSGTSTTRAALATTTTPTAPTRTAPNTWAPATR